MVKYVDCEKAKEMFNRYFHNLQGSEAQILVCDMKQAFLELPTADVQEVRHGRWVNESRLMYGPISAQCSVRSKKWIEKNRLKKWRKLCAAVVLIIMSVCVVCVQLGIMLKLYIKQATANKNRYIKSKRPNLSKWYKKQSNRKLRRNKNLITKQLV